MKKQITVALLTLMSCGYALSSLATDNARTNASGTSASVSTLTKEPNTPNDDDISDILTNAKAHDGIVIGGLYLGMDIDDAMRVASHLLGPGYARSDWKRANYNEHYWKYYIGGVPGVAFKNEDENSLVFWVLKKNFRVETIWINTSVLRKLVGKTQPVSKERLGALFFSKFDLDGTHEYGDNGRMLAMTTSEGERIVYNQSSASLWWGYEFGKTPAELEP